MLSDLAGLSLLSISPPSSPVWRECGKGYLTYQGWSQGGLCYRIREWGWGENLNWDQREPVELRPTTSFECLVNA